MCSDMDGKILKGGLAIENKRDDYMLEYGSQIFSNMKPTYIHLHQCMSEFDNTKCMSIKSRDVIVSQNQKTVSGALPRKGFVKLQEMLA